MVCYYSAVVTDRADDGTNFPESAEHDKADLVIWRRGDSRMTTAVH